VKKILLLIITISFGFFSCEKDCAENVRSCIQEWIDVVKKETPWNPPAAVKEYRYNGKTVYLLSANCCDEYRTLIDGECNYICAPDGGISGKGDGKCVDFYEKAEFIRVVWQDGR
jgi:hypothetical protein